MSFLFKRLEIPDIILIEPRCLQDERGYFMETYTLSEFFSGGIRLTFVQDNCSRSVRGVLRGMHYQKQPRAQGKLVKVIRGEIFDVGIDIRKNSPTYGKWAGEILSAGNFRMLYLPPGFAHGFCVLSEQADVIYKVTEEYAPDFDRGIIWNDPEIGIEWPIREPILSAKDAQLPFLRDADNNFEIE